MPIHIPSACFSANVNFPEIRLYKNNGHNESIIGVRIRE